MDLVKAGIGISKTIRNVGRLQEIVMVFARNGFDEFITNKATNKIPNFVLPKSKKRITEELADYLIILEPSQHSVPSELNKKLKTCEKYVYKSNYIYKLQNKPK